MPTSSLPTISVRHVQEEPAATWTIAHGQNGYPVVDAYTAENGTVQKILPMGVEYVDEDTVRILFSSPRTGFATVVI